MSKPTSTLIIMGDKQMRIALGSLYVLDKPISAYDHGTQLVTKSYEILVAMLVGFSEAKRMLFYIIGIRKLSLLKRLEEISYRMSNCDLPFPTYVMGKMIKNILRAINYYLTVSEIIGMIRIIKNDILSVIKQSKKQQKSELIEIAKNNISKIIKAMSTDRVASVSIKRKRLSLFESYIWCESRNIKQMKWHEVGRIVDIKQWPIEAIRLWTKYQLCLQTGSFIITDPITDETKEALIEAIQRDNVSKRSTLHPENLRSKDLLHAVEHGEIGIDLWGNDGECCNRHRNNSPQEYVNEPPGEAYARRGQIGERPTRTQRYT